MTNRGPAGKSAGYCYKQQLSAVLMEERADPLLRNLSSGVLISECMTPLGKKLGDCTKEELYFTQPLPDGCVLIRAGIADKLRHRAGTV